jgi:dihydrofolate reductase/thymidylate synthase
MNTKPDFSIIVASTKNGGIGMNNSIPWKLPTDLQFFRNVTTKTDHDTMINAVIMGKFTWQSLPRKPLPNRINVILSHKNDIQSSHQLGVISAYSLDNALEKLSQIHNINKIYVIGGEKLYNEAIKHSSAKYVYMTSIDAEIVCDTFFPIKDLNMYYEKIYESDKRIDNTLPICFEEYRRIIKKYV